MEKSEKFTMFFIPFLTLFTIYKNKDLFLQTPDPDLLRQTRFYESHAYAGVYVWLSRNLRLCVANLCLYYYICSSAVLHGTVYLTVRSSQLA